MALADDDSRPQLSAGLRGQPWARHVAPPEALKFPSMLAKQEKNLLHWLAQRYWTGAGEIVDAGCFLGGSTMCFATGLRDRNTPAEQTRSWRSRWLGGPSAPVGAAAWPPPAQPRLHAFDNFVVDRPAVLEDFARPLDGVPLHGSCRPAFDRLTAAVQPYFRTCHGDLAELGWTGQPIEVLFLDVLKSPDLNDAVLRDFFPCLIPGRTALVQQDYVHEWLPWIHVTMEILADCFEYQGWMPHATAVFLNTKPIPAATLAACRWAAIPGAEKLRLMDRAVARFDGLPRGLIDCAKGVLLAEVAGGAAALAHWRQCGRTYAGLRQVTVAAEQLSERHARLLRAAA